jgi:hypothetical protein
MATEARRLLASAAKQIARSKLLNDASRKKIARALWLMQQSDARIVKRNAPHGQCRKQPYARG